MTIKRILTYLYKALKGFTVAKHWLVDRSFNHFDALQLFNSFLVKTLRAISNFVENRETEKKKSERAIQNSIRTRRIVTDKYNDFMYEFLFLYVIWILLI